jgi:hypothetical protein
MCGGAATGEDSYPDKSTPTTNLAEGDERKKEVSTRRGEEEEKRSRRRR